MKLRATANADYQCNLLQVNPYVLTPAQRKSYALECISTSAVAACERIKSLGPAKLNETVKGKIYWRNK